MILLIVYLWNNPGICSQAALSCSTTCWNNDSFKPFLTFYFLLDYIIFGEVKQRHAAGNVKKWVKCTSWWLFLNIGICLCNWICFGTFSGCGCCCFAAVTDYGIAVGMWSREESLLWKKETKEGQVNYSNEIEGVLKLHVKKIPALLASRTGWHHSLCCSESFLSCPQCSGRL